MTDKGPVNQHERTLFKYVGFILGLNALLAVAYLSLTGHLNFGTLANSLHLVPHEELAQSSYVAEMYDETSEDKGESTFAEIVEPEHAPSKNH